MVKKGILSRQNGLNDGSPPLKSGLKAQDSAF